MVLERMCALAELLKAKTKRRSRTSFVCAVCNCIKLPFFNNSYQPLCITASMENARICGIVKRCRQHACSCSNKGIQKQNVSPDKQTNRRIYIYIYKTFYKPYQPLCIAGSIENAWNCGIAQRLEMQATCSLMFE